MEYLEVYLHIVEAIDIKGVERNGNSDPYIQVMAPNEKGKLQVLYKTDTIKNTRNPKYNAELLIRVPSTTDNIVLRVKDWNALLKDKKLGFVVLPLNKIPNHANVEEYPIEEGGGKLKLCTRFIRAIGIPRDYLIPVKELPKVRIHLEHYTYHPGEVVRGHLVLSELMKDNEAEKSITLRVTSVWNGIHYLDIHERFDIVKGSSGVWAFQFLIPKRIPTKNSDLEGMLHLCIYAPTETCLCAETRIVVMPSYEGLAPKFSPRRPEPPPMDPSGLILTWVDLPKFLNGYPRGDLKFTLHNPGTHLKSFYTVHISLKYQRVVTKLEPSSPVGWISNETIIHHCDNHLGFVCIQIGASETKEFTTRLPTPSSVNLSVRDITSAPFEVFGDFYELNFFLEVEGRSIRGDPPVVLCRTPIFCVPEWFIRETPPNYELAMAPDTFWVAAVEDPNLLCSLRSPSMFVYPPWCHPYPDITFFISELVSTETFSTLRRETMTRLPNGITDLPPLTSIFDVPFDDAC